MSLATIGDGIGKRFTRFKPKRTEKEVGVTGTLVVVQGTSRQFLHLIIPTTILVTLDQFLNLAPIDISTAGAIDQIDPFGCHAILHTTNTGGTRVNAGIQNANGDTNAIVMGKRLTILERIGFLLGTKSMTGNKDVIVLNGMICM